MRSRLAMLLMTVVAVMSIAIFMSRLASADRARDAAMAQLLEVRRDAQEVIDLRAASQRVNARERPAQDVIAMVNAAMAEAGIPNAQFKGLSPEADVALAPRNGPNVTPAGYRRQSLRLSLAGLSVADLGRFLAAWRQSQQIWTVTRLELTHQRSPEPVGGDAYDVTIILAATYIAEGAAQSSASRLDL